MRADLLFHKGEEGYQEAMHHLQELLCRKPGEQAILHEEDSASNSRKLMLKVAIVANNALWRFERSVFGAFSIHDLPVIGSNTLRHNKPLFGGHVCPLFRGFTDCITNSFYNPCFQYCAVQCAS